MKADPGTRRRSKKGVTDDPVSRKRSRKTMFRGETFRCGKTFSKVFEEREVASKFFSTTDETARSLGTDLLEKTSTKEVMSN